MARPKADADEKLRWMSSPSQMACPLSGELGREQSARVVVQEPDHVLAFYSARRIVFAFDEDLLWTRTVAVSEKV